MLMAEMLRIFVRGKKQYDYSFIDKGDADADETFFYVPRSGREVSETS